MSFKDLFFIFSKNDYEKDLKKKLTSLEMNIKELKTSLSAWEENKAKSGDTQNPQNSPIIIEKINIEKIIVDKYELNNNFGQLGIKELKGKLNIGATYGSEFTPKLDEEEKEENGKKQRVKNPSKENGPKVNIKAKQD